MAKDKLRYQCTTCKWKFATTIRPNLCPYCGKTSLTVDTSKGAEDLLREVEDMEAQFSARRV